MLAFIGKLVIMGIIVYLYKYTEYISSKSWIRILYFIAITTALLWVFLGTTLHGSLFNI